MFYSTQNNYFLKGSTIGALGDLTEAEGQIPLEGSVCMGAVGNENQHIHRYERLELL